jgi:hypothetical protein
VDNKLPILISPYLLNGVSLLVTCDDFLTFPCPRRTIQTVEMNLEKRCFEQWLGWFFSYKYLKNKNLFVKD